MRPRIETVIASAVLLIAAGAVHAQVGAGDPGQKPARPGDLAATVEALLAVDAKAAVQGNRPVSQVKVARPTAATAKPDDGLGRARVEYIVGQGKNLVAGLNIDGKSIQVRHADVVGAGYRVTSIEGGCVVAIKPQQPVPAPAQQSRRKHGKAGDPTKSAMWPRIEGTGHRWCFNETDAADMAPKPIDARPGFTNQTGLPMLLPKGSPLPVAGP